LNTADAHGKSRTPLAVHPHIKLTAADVNTGHHHGTNPTDIPLATPDPNIPIINKNAKVAGDIPNNYRNTTPTTHAFYQIKKCKKYSK
jgi:hypothetical protein